MAKKRRKYNEYDNVTTLRIVTPRFNIGVVLLVLIFIYLCVSIFMFLTKKKVNIYEVNAGQLVSENSFTGVAIYDEELVYSDKAGYISYFTNDNDRAGHNTIICSVDEVGTVAKQLSTTAQSTDALSNTTFNNISKQLVSLSKDFNSMEYYQAYNVLDNISSTVAEYKSSYLISELKNLITDNAFVYVYTPSESTMVSFYVDSLFGINEGKVNTDTFNMEKYNGTNLRNRELVGVGEVLYRRFNSDTWKIVFPLSQNQVSNYAGIDVMNVKFKDSPISTKASFSIISGADGSYGVLTLEKYLINFTDSRFVDFELALSSVTGLKVPISSVCEKEFYTIPEEYAVSSDDDTKNTGFLLQFYDEAGNKNRKFIEATYYARENGYLYVSKDIFTNGDCIVMPPGEDGQISFNDEIYIVGTLGSLKGTYCINKGYCQFRRVKILEKNDEYYIVERGTLYGLSIYDHIILNADYVSENQIIY